MNLKQLFNQWARSCSRECADKQWLLSKWDILQGAEWGTEKISVLKTHICDLLKFQRGDGFLDLGCGGGWLLEVLEEYVSQAVGCDIAFEMLRHASSSGKWINADGRRLPFADNTFDKILCYFVFINFGQWEDVAAVMKDIIRVLKPGGRALIGQIPDKKGSRQYDTEAEKYRSFCYENFPISGSNRDTSYIPVALFERQQFESLLKELPCDFSLVDSFNPFYRPGEKSTVPWRFDIICEKNHEAP